MPARLPVMLTAVLFAAAGAYPTCCYRPNDAECLVLSGRLLEVSIAIIPADYWPGCYYTMDSMRSLVSNSYLLLAFLLSVGLGLVPLNLHHQGGNPLPE